MQGLRERLTVLERELGRLQRQNLQLRWLLLGVLLLSWLPYLLATQERTVTFHTVRAQRIEIVSPEGITVMALSTVPLRGGDALGFFDKNDKCVASFGSFLNGGSLGIYNKDGKLVVDFSSNPDGGSLRIGNKDGELVATLFSKPDGVSLSILNKNKELVATLFSNADGGYLGIYNKDKKLVVLLGADLLTGGGGLRIYNKDEKEVITLGVIPDMEPSRKLGAVGSGIIFIGDRDGNRVAAIGADRLGGAITLFNPLGGVTFHAP